MQQFHFWAYSQKNRKQDLEEVIGVSVFMETFTLTEMLMQTEYQLLDELIDQQNIVYTYSGI